LFARPGAGIMEDQVSESQATSQADGTQQAASQAGAGTTDQASAREPTEVKDLPKWAQDHIKSLRDEAATHRTKAQQLEDKDKTELQRIADERDRLKNDLDGVNGRMRDMAIRAALTTAVTKAGAKHPDLLVDRLSKQAELDDELNVKNADKLVTEAKKEYPDLFRVVDGGVDGGKGRDDGSSGKPDMNRLIRRQVGYAT
jgi:hypothetical protein